MSNGKIPHFLDGDVRERIAARGRESTFLVDEAAEEVLVAYTGFTDALKREYENASQSRDEDSLKVYHLTKESWAIQLVKYDDSSGVDGEVVWRDKLV